MVYILVLILSTGDICPGVQPVYTVPQFTYRSLSVGVQPTYMVFDLPTGVYRRRVQPVYTFFDPTYRRLCAKGAACLYHFWSYLQGSVRTGGSLFIWFGSYLQRTVRPGCGLFIRLQNLPTGACWPGVQPVYSLQTQLQGTVGLACSLFTLYMVSRCVFHSKCLLIFCHLMYQNYIMVQYLYF